MDPELQKKIDEARAAGYNDDEINQYLESVNNPRSQQGLGPMDRSQEHLGLIQGMGADTALNALEYGVPGAAAYYGVKKLINNIKGPVAPAQSMAQANQVASSQAIQQPMQQAVNGPAVSNTPNTPQTTNQFPAEDNRIKFPIKPNVEPTTPVAEPIQQPQSMVQRGMQYADKVKQIAMEKVISNAMKAGVGAAAALTPGNIGQNYPVPQSGPYRGMEINPMTGRPWTQQELAQLR
jgi:hypothetical protein